MKSLWNRNPRPGAVSAGVYYTDPLTGETALYSKGADWMEPDSVVPAQPGAPVVRLELGPGQAIGLSVGGLYAVDRP